MNYYRKTVNNVVDNVKLKMQIASLTLKLSENNGNISSNLSKININTSDISNSKTDISSNLSKINTNTSDISNSKTDISSNLSKINTNTSNISSNLSKINTNKSDISSNLSKINTNESNISSNLSKINTNKSNITNNYNISQINKKKSEFNTTLIDNNKNNISSNLSKINTIEQNYKLKDIIIIDIIKSNIPEIIDNNNNEFIIINSSLNNLKKDSYLQFDSSIFIFFHKHYINIGFFHILLEYFNDKNVLIESIKMPIIGMISRYANITNSCIIKIPNDLDKIYHKLSIKLNNNQNRSDSISILDFDNKIYFEYFEK